MDNKNILFITDVLFQACLKLTLVQRGELFTALIDSQMGKDPDVDDPSVRFFLDWHNKEVEKYREGQP